VTKLKPETFLSIAPNILIIVQWWG